MARKIPRGKGYDKASTLKHLRRMVQSGSLVTSYVKTAGLKLDTFMLAIKQYADPKFVESTRSFVDSPLIVADPHLIWAQCGYCGEDYWPSKQGTKWCSSYCGNLSRKDEQYFGGNRRQTIGLKEGVCGLCGRRPDSGLSSHHLYGKHNDTGNEHLLALCKGCHAIVSDLALKTWCGDAQVLERLIVLAWTQRDGAHLLKEKKENGSEVGVSVSFYPHVTS